MTLSTPATLCDDYLAECGDILRRIVAEESEALDRAAACLADQLAADRLVHIYGPGGHSNLAAQELFYRAGTPMLFSPILHPGTLLSNGALRSTAIERRPGYGATVIATAGLGQNDLLLLVNAFGVNAAVIDAAMCARERGVVVIGLSSRSAAEAIPADHPARHSSAMNLHDIVDIAIDTKIPDGDAALVVAGLPTPVGPVATIANAFALNVLTLRTIGLLEERGERTALWQSRNAAAGDANQAERVDAIRQRVPSL